MTPRQMQRAFELSLAHLDKTLADKILSTDIFYYLDIAQDRFISDRAKDLSNQQNFDDLRTIITKASVTLNVEGEIPNGKNFSLPADYYIGINCIANITNVNKQPSDYWTQAKTVDIFTIDDYIYNGNNKPILDNPLLFYYDNKGIIIYDPEDTLVNARLMYIKNAAGINSSVSSDLPNHTHEEIVEIAVELALKTLSIQDNVSALNDGVQRNLEQ